MVTTLGVPGRVIEIRVLGVPPYKKYLPVKNGVKTGSSYIIIGRLLSNSRGPNMAVCGPSQVRRKVASMGRGVL